MVNILNGVKCTFFYCILKRLSHDFFSGKIHSFGEGINIVAFASSHSANNCPNIRKIEFLMDSDGNPSIVRHCKEIYILAKEKSFLIIYHYMHSTNTVREGIIISIIGYILIKAKWWNVVTSSKQDSLHSEEEIWCQRGTDYTRDCTHHYYTVTHWDM